MMPVKNQSSDQKTNKSYEIKHINEFYLSYARITVDLFLIKLEFFSGERKQN